MRLFLSIVIVSFTVFIGDCAFADNQNKQSDAEICKEILGTWVSGNSKEGGVITFTLNGHFTSSITNKYTNWVSEGTWKIKDGTIISTVKKTSSPDKSQGIIYAKIIHITGDELTYEIYNDPRIENYTVPLRRAK